MTWTGNRTHRISGWRGASGSRGELGALGLAAGTETLESASTPPAKRRFRHDAAGTVAGAEEENVVCWHGGVSCHFDGVRNNRRAAPASNDIFTFMELSKRHEVAETPEPHRSTTTSLVGLEQQSSAWPASISR